MVSLQIITSKVFFSVIFWQEYPRLAGSLRLLAFGENQSYDLENEEKRRRREIFKFKK